jgi:hypothetical protein
MYRCDYCRREFDEPKTIHTTYESLYGVSGLFGNSTPCSYDVCPYCGDEDIEEVEEDEE